jgi:2-polyprenyl-6-methoxyphenol hydroxylase-like FAD-dependent oxidoreductase
MRVLIAGGGIAGLTLALSLHQRGIDCLVLEGSGDWREAGVGINCLPHAVAELAALDLLADLDAAAVRTRTLTYTNRFGQEIWAEPRGLWAGHAYPQLSIRRGRLHGILLAAARRRLGAGPLRSAHRLIAFERTGQRIVGRFSTPQGEVEIAGDALVGCDGLHSVVRTTLHPDDGGIRWTGIRIWRGMTEWPAWRGGDHMLCAGDMGEKLVLYPVGPGRTDGARLTNWALCARHDGDGFPPPREDWSRLGREEEALRHVRRFRMPDLEVGALIAATAEIFEYPMADRDPLPWWTRGRVTLLGDAAHPMYPTGSNGAAQAILDARCLARCLADRPAEDALRAYEAERRSATEAIVLSNRAGGPERILDLVGSRAPDGFERIEDVIGQGELAVVGLAYAKLAGFATDRSRRSGAE